MYDKANVLPPKGSLREALFLTVWLKRQEQELQRTRMMAQGFVDLAAAAQKDSAVPPIFKEFMAALLPYSKKAQGEKDQEMAARMKKEVEKGVLVFNTPGGERHLLDRAKTMRLPDEFRQKLAAAKLKRRVEL